ncbi:SDR family oxidoreductase [Alkalinema pantanalense CENA528]|uniref:SDR family oxidoreductase n=1 Tax=Alkalinema pantanalense TaxID=1620705 RepID=UPI003D6FF175
MKLQNKVAIVTGSGTGIGRATAILLAQQGARIGVIDRTIAQSQETVKTIESQGGQAIWQHADVSQPDQMEQAIEQVMRQWGRIDIVVANAGINGTWAPIEDLLPEEWDTTLHTNLKGTFLTVKYAVPYLKQRSEGSIIIVSSVNGTRGFSLSGATAYACSKAAQVAFAKMIALELAKYHIRVNVICPGAIETGINDHDSQRRRLEEIQEPVEFPRGNIPLTGGHPGKSEDVAQLVLFLASTESSYITGTEIWIDGAESLIKG